MDMSSQAECWISPSRFGHCSTRSANHRFVAFRQAMVFRLCRMRKNGRSILIWIKSEVRRFSFRAFATLDFGMPGGEPGPKTAETGSESDRS